MVGQNSHYDSGSAIYKSSQISTVYNISFLQVMATESPKQPASKANKTEQLSQWASSVKLDDIPPEIITRAKYIVLDGIACGLVGAHLPWSAKAAEAVFAMDPPADCKVIGWERSLPPLSAALLNGTFIQGFELDDWHSEAPLHSNSILIPALLACAQHLNTQNSAHKISGADFLLGMIVGYEVSAN